MKRLLLMTLALVLCSYVFSQEVWSLQKCVEHAIENSLSIQQAQLSLQNTQLTGTSLKHQRYPNLNASSGFGINFGRQINPATNDFETENSLFNSIGLNSGVNIYAGNQLTNSIKQNKLDEEASVHDLMQSKNDLALSVALTYLNVLFAYENLANAENTKVLTERQLDQLNKFIAAGTRPENEKYDLLAQLASDEQNIIQFENSVVNNLLALKQLLLLDAAYPLEVETPDIDLDDIEALETYNIEAVYNAAVNNQPLIKASELRLRSAEMEVDIAKGSMMPSLSVSGSIGSNWSDLAKQADGFNTLRIPQEGVFINGESALFEVEQTIPTSISQIPYPDQLNNNLGYGFSASLRIPIYNNFQGKVAVERAKLNILSTETNNEQIRQTLKTDIQNAITAARAAKKTLQASDRSLEASQIAFDNAVKRFDVGVINSFEFLNAQDRLESAKVNVTIAKYDYIFRVKVIEYYLGRGLSIQ